MRFAAGPAVARGGRDGEAGAAGTAAGGRHEATGWRDGGLGAGGRAAGGGDAVRRGAVERVTALKVPHRICPRRPGDPAVLVASNAKARAVLGWSPKRDLDEIIRSAYDFMRRHPEGYPEVPSSMDEMVRPLRSRAEPKASA